MNYPLYTTVPYLRWYLFSDKYARLVVVEVVEVVEEVEVVGMMVVRVVEWYFPKQFCISILEREA